MPATYSVICYTKMKSLLSKGTRDLTGRDFTGLLTLMAFGSVNSMSRILYGIQTHSGCWLWWLFWTSKQMRGSEWKGSFCIMKHPFLASVFKGIVQQKKEYSVIICSLWCYCKPIWHKRYFEEYFLQLFCPLTESQWGPNSTDWTPLTLMRKQTTLRHLWKIFLCSIF